MQIALISVAPPYRGGISKHTSILVEKLSKAHFIAAVRKNVISESKNRLGKELHESVPPMEALEAFLKERDIDENKMRLLLEKGQTLMFENPPTQP